MLPSVFKFKKKKKLKSKKENLAEDRRQGDLPRHSKDKQLWSLTLFRSDDISVIDERICPRLILLCFEGKTLTEVKSKSGKWFCINRMGICIHSLCAKGLKLTNRTFFRQFRPEPKSPIWFLLSPTFTLFYWTVSTMFVKGLGLIASQTEALFCVQNRFCYSNLSPPTLTFKWLPIKNRRYSPNFWKFLSD